jgi:ankyrin repeat protein
MAAVFQLVVDQQADAQEKDTYGGYTSLHKAAENGHTAAIQLLLERQANIQAKDMRYGHTPLHKAAENGHTEAIQLLLDYKADINDKTKHAEPMQVDSGGLTPLHKAVEQGRLDVAQLLLKYQADVHSKDDRGDTPLHKTVVQKCLGVKGSSYVIQGLTDRQIYDNVDGRVAAVQLLLEYNADIESTNHKELTPLQLAARCKSREVVLALLHKKADINKLDEDEHSYIEQLLKEAPL